MKPRCSIVRCNNPNNAKGLCCTHYRRFRLYGDPLKGAIRPERHLTCSVAGCLKPNERRGMCQMHFWRLQHKGDVNYTRPERPLCAITGCEQTIKAYGMCQFHWSRTKKGIDFSWVKPTLAKRRYRSLTRRNHPLADKRGKVTEHRMVLYDTVEGSRLPCFWCGTPLEWKDNLVVDHLNHNRHDNSPTNLVPSCNSCNCGRTINNSHIRKSIYSSADTSVVSLTLT